MIQRDFVSFKNVLALFGLHQQVRSPSAHHVHAMIDEVLDGLDQPHFLRLPIHHSQQDHAEAFLHLRVLIKLVEHDLGLAAALQFNDNAHPVAIAFIADV